MIRILLVDDHPVFRLGLRTLLDQTPDLEVLAEAENGEEALELVGQINPDVIVMDLLMPGMSGLEATRRLQELKFPGSILILTVHAQERYLFPVLQAGGSGYVLKSAAHDELVEAIRTVARGEVYLQPGLATNLLTSIWNRGDIKHMAPDKLTQREREILQSVAEGFTSSEIAENLVISPKTVETHRKRIMMKLGLRRRHELVEFALKVGLLIPHPD